MPCYVAIRRQANLNTFFWCEKSRLMSGNLRYYGETLFCSALNPPPWCKFKPDHSVPENNQPCGRPSAQTQPLYSPPLHGSPAVLGGSPPRTRYQPCSWRPASRSPDGASARDVNSNQGHSSDRQTGHDWNRE